MYRPVVYTPSTPIFGDFLSTNAQGAPFVIDRSAGMGYYLDPTDTPRPLITNASLVNFIQSRVFAKTRTIQSKAQETLSVFDCMDPLLQVKVSLFTASIADYPAIDLAIQQTIENAHQRAPNQDVEIFFPDGDYYYNSVTIPYDRIRLVGSARLIKSTNTGDGILFTGGSSRIFGGGVVGLTFGAAVPCVSGSLLKFYRASQLELKCTVKPFPAACWRGIHIEECTAVHGSNVYISNCLETGLHIFESMDVYLTSSRSDANGLYGMLLNNCAGMYFNSITCWGNDSSNWIVKAVGAVPVFADTHGFMFFTNCIADFCGGHGWDIERLANSVFAACWSSSQKVTTPDLNGIILRGCSDLEFAGHVSLNNNGAGCAFEDVGSVRILFNGGRFNDNGKVSTSSHRVGIKLNSTSDVILSSVTTTDTRSIGKTQQYGVKCEGVLLSLIMTLHDMRGNAAGPYTFPNMPSYFRQSLCLTGETGVYASATTVTISPFIDTPQITGNIDIYDIVPKWNNRQISCDMTGTARFIDQASGSSFALPTPTITPAAQGTANFICRGSLWLHQSSSINDGI